MGSRRSTYPDEIPGHQRNMPPNQKQLSTDFSLERFVNGSESVPNHHFCPNYSMEYPDQGSQFQSFEHNSSQPAMFTEINMGPFNTPEQHYYNKSSLNVPPPQAYQAQSYTGASNSHGLTQKTSLIQEPHPPTQHRPFDNYDQTPLFRNPSERGSSCVSFSSISPCPSSSRRNSCSSLYRELSPPRSYNRKPEEEKEKDAYKDQRKRNNQAVKKCRVEKNKKNAAVEKERDQLKIQMYRLEGVAENEKKEKAELREKYEKLQREYAKVREENEWLRRDNESLRRSFGCEPSTGCSS